MKQLFSFFHKPSAVFLSLILLIGFLLRMQGVFSQTFAFTYDVGRDMLALFALVYQHKIPLIGPTTGLPGLFYGPWWYYILAVPYALSGGNPAGVTTFMALTGVATALVMYGVGKKVSGEFLGVALAGLVSVSPSLIAVSSQIWNPNLAPLFLSLLIFVFSLILESKIDHSKKKKVVSRIMGKAPRNVQLYFFCTGMLLSLSLDMEVVYGTTLIIALILFIVFQLRKYLTVTTLAMLVLGFGIILLPRIVFDLRHHFLMSSHILAFLHNSATPTYSLSFMERVVNRFRILKDLWDDSVGGSLSWIGWMMLIFSVVSVVSAYRNAQSLERRLLVLCCTAVATYFVVLVLFKQDIWGHYLVGLPIFYVLFLGLSMNLALRALGKQMIFAGLIILLFLINIHPLHVFADYTHSKWEGDPSVYRNNLAVIDYIYHEAHGKPFNYILYTPPVNDYTYQYLFKWYGQKTYGYQPASQKTSLFFVILEPDPGYPDRPKMWLQQRKNDGKIIKQDTLPGDITIQTRLH